MQTQRTSRGLAISRDGWWVVKTSVISETWVFPSTTETTTLEPKQSSIQSNGGSRNRSPFCTIDTYGSIYGPVFTIPSTRHILLKASLPASRDSLITSSFPPEAKVAALSLRARMSDLVLVILVCVVHRRCFSFTPSRFNLERTRNRQLVYVLPVVSFAFVGRQRYFLLGSTIPEASSLGPRAALDCEMWRLCLWLASLLLVRPSWVPTFWKYFGSIYFGKMIDNCPHHPYTPIADVPMI